MCYPDRLTKDSKGISITVTANPCDIPIEGNASAIDEFTDRAIVESIREKLADGNMWAWCEVTVKVTYRDTLSASAYLGGCSYDSERDFRHDNGYFGEMVQECINRLNKDLGILCGPDKKGA